MRISLNWIEGLLGVQSLGCPDEELVHRLTMHLAEIDGLERTGPELSGVVVGLVRSCEPHPDADRLRCCMVDVGGDEPLPIVCGAPNVATGQHVAVATVGTRLTMPGKDGEPVCLTIKKGKLRGQASHGMICAEDELGLGPDHSGILVLDGRLEAPAAPGTPLAAVWPAGDRVLEIDNHNINHRPDLWGHLGWAREIAAIQDLQPPAPVPTCSPDEPGDWQVRIEDSGCICYRGAVVTGLRNEASPDWMQEALLSCGQRPRGLLVDLTNYLMLELGEPMHAFDRRQISGSTLVVRSAADGEAFTTLDERSHELQSGDLLIADEQRPLALAGIMGGLDSMVAADTDTIVLEAATFEQGRIRRTRIRTGCSSESSNRFEKGLYPELTGAAIERAIAILQELQPAARVTARFGAGRAANAVRSIAFDPALTRRYLGLDLSPGEQARLLHSLGCDCDDGLGTVTIPWWRARDLGVPVDLVEEIGRLHGYERCPAEVPRLPAATPQPNRLRRAEHRTRRQLSSLGWDEIATYGFASEEWATALDWPADRVLRLSHPLAADQSVLRMSLAPGLLAAAAENRKHLPAVHAYEVGKIYGRDLGTGETPDERLQIGGVVCSDAEESPVYAARDAAIAVLEALGHEPDLRVCADPGPELMSGRAAELLVADEPVARIGEVPPALRQRVRLQQPAGLFIIELERLLERHGRGLPVAYQAVSRFQPVEREFTFVAPEQLYWKELAGIVVQAAGQLCRSVDLVTVYRGEPIPEQHKAVSVRVVLQADDRTLGDKDLDQAQRRIIAAVERQSQARLRA
ncbi:MAG: phenylalanine--tRNA ligase subunit beta [Planctomycetota bacterium]